MDLKSDNNKNNQITREAKMKNYYKILGVTSNASTNEIREAYINLVKKFHPDLCSGNTQYAEEKMKDINEAYRMLKDPILREKYNEENNFFCEYENEKNNEDSFSVEKAKDTNFPNKQYEKKTNLLLVDLFCTLSISAIVISIIIGGFILFKNKIRLAENLLNKKIMQTDITIDEIKNELYEEYFPVYIFLDYESKETKEKIELFIDDKLIDQFDISGMYKYGVIITKGQHSIEFKSGIQRKKEVIAIQTEMVENNEPIVVIGSVRKENGKILINSFSYDVKNKLNEDYIKIFYNDLNRVIGIGPFNDVMKEVE